MVVAAAASVAGDGICDSVVAAAAAVAGELPDDLVAGGLAGDGAATPRIMYFRHVPDRIALARYCRHRGPHSMAVDRACLNISPQTQQHDTRLGSLIPLSYVTDIAHITVSVTWGNGNPIGRPGA